MTTPAVTYRRTSIAHRPVSISSPHRSALAGHDPDHLRLEEDVAPLLLEPAGQLVGEHLRASPRIVVAEEVGEPEHRVEHERST